MPCRPIACRGAGLRGGTPTKGFVVAPSEMINDLTYHVVLLTSRAEVEFLRLLKKLSSWRRKSCRESPWLFSGSPPFSAKILSYFLDLTFVNM